MDTIIRSAWDGVKHEIDQIQLDLEINKQLGHNSLQTGMAQFRIANVQRLIAVIDEKHDLDVPYPIPTT